MKSSQRASEWPAAAQRNSWIYYRSVLNGERYTRSPVNNSAARPSWRSPINVETAVVRYGHAPYDAQNLLQVRRPRLGAQMSAWIATALAVVAAAMSTITAVSAGSCGPGSTHNCFNLPTTIDFSSVPEISKQIVSEEKTGQKQKQPTGEPPAAAPYTGPIFGASPRPGRTPVVGYSWSLE